MMPRIKQLFCAACIFLMTSGSVVYTMEMSMEPSMEMPMDVPPDPSVVPDVSIQAPASTGIEPQPGQALLTPSATPSAAPTPDVKTEQFGWPDTIELVENKTSAAAGGPEVLLVYKESEKKLTDIATIINTLNKMRENIYKKFFDLDAMLDGFLQKVSADAGSLEETFSKEVLK